MTELETVLLKFRMQSIQYESTLLKQVVALQRARIATLERRLHGTESSRLARWNLSHKPFGICRNCGQQAGRGQVFCSRTCLHEDSRSRKAAAGKLSS